MDLSFYTNFSASLAAQEAQINILQQQIATGLSVSTPEQNPAVYETAALGNDQVSRLANDNITQASIQVQLGSANDAYSSTADLLNNVQAIVEQALNGTSNGQNLNALASQVQSAQQQLLAIGNTTSPNGTYLFGGSRGGLAPFQQDGNGNIAYFGDGGSSQASIGEGTTASSIANGTVFVSALQGDGIGYITANAANTGSGQILSEGTVNAPAANAFQQGNAPITVSFGTGGTYTATQGGATIATGTLSTAPGGAGTSLTLAGVDYNIIGAPASGDSFTIAPARTQSAFTLLQNIYSALANAGSTPAALAQTDEALNQGLAGIAQYQQNVTTAQAQNGVTLQAIAATGTGNTEQSTETQVNIDNATAVNAPVAISALDQTLTALQAAMKTFGDVQGLSLFNYL
jgi:flagellar hook-associated protein 3 FlgL